MLERRAWAVRGLVSGVRIPFNNLYQRIVALIDASGAAVVCEQFMAAERRKGMSSWQGCSYGIPPR